MVGKDAYLNAETGTGKTLAYLLPLFARIDPT
jgi:ATP-dependent RNA helicase DeaD